MRLVAVVAAAWLSTAAFVACSSFSADDQPDIDAGGFDATSEPATDEPDSQIADAGADASWGCKGTTATWDFSTSTPPSPIGADPIHPPSFDSITEDGGTFGRFTLSFDEPDGSDSGPPLAMQYGVALRPTTTHLCLSARIRTPKPTPQSASVQVLLAAGYTAEGTFGIASLDVAGSVIEVAAAFGPQTDSGVPVVDNAVSGQVTDWHVARVDTFREAAQLRFTLSFDGVQQLDVMPFPEGATVASGLNAFGPSTDVVLPGVTTAVDYADVRVDVE